MAAHTLESVREYISTVGWSLASKCYRDTHAPISVLCPNGHTTPTTFRRFQQVKDYDNYCDDCNGRSFKAVKRKLAEYNWRLVTTKEEWKNCSMELKALCLKRHEKKFSGLGSWTRAVVKKGRLFCRTCSNREILTEASYHKLAKEHGGTWVGESLPKNNGTLTMWQCERDHPSFSRTYSNLSKHKWCKRCGHHVGETARRIIFEALFSRKQFPSIYPEWLVNPKSGKRLELDGYCEKAPLVSGGSKPLAFEHQGEPHEKQNDFFHRKKGNSLKEIKYRDRLKKRLCKANGVTLIHVPSIFHEIQFEEAIKLIHSKCMELGFKVRKTLPKISLTTIFLTDYSEEQFKKLEEEVKDKGSISGAYIEAHLKTIHCKCKCGYEWDSNPNNIFNGCWCVECANREKKGAYLRIDATKAIKEVKGIVTAKNGELLEASYTNNHTRSFKMVCEKGHKPFKKNLKELRDGGWCPDNECRYARTSSSRKETEEKKRLKKGYKKDSEGRFWRLRKNSKGFWHAFCYCPTEGKNIAARSMRTKNEAEAKRLFNEQYG